MITKSLYGKQSVVNAVTSNISQKQMGQYGIKIKSPTLGEIDGILKDPIGFGVEANWQTLGLEGIIDSVMASNGILKTIDTVVDAANLAAGSSFTNTGLFSKLFYKNSGRLGISPTFRIFDFNGSGICTVAATRLMALCIPSIKKSLDIEPIISNAEDLIRKGEEEGKKVPIAKQLIEAKNKFLETETGKQMTSVYQKGRDSLASTQANWSDAPSPVSIQIGNWLTITQAVVQSVNCQFSFECTDAGPMYVDVSMKLDTIENLAIGSNEMLEQVIIGQNRSDRVKITQSRTPNTNRVF